MTKIDARQQMYVKLAAAADTRWRDAKFNLEAEIRAEMRARSQHLLEARNDAVLLAHEAGCPKVRLAVSALHTRNVEAVRHALADARERRRLQREASPPRFARGQADGEVIVSISGAEFAEACVETGWTVDEAIRAGVTTARFRVVNAAEGPAPALVAITKSFLPDYDKQHPTVRWGRAHSAEGLAWWKGVAA